MQVIVASAPAGLTAKPGLHASVAVVALSSSQMPEPIHGGLQGCCAERGPEWISTRTDGKNQVQECREEGERSRTAGGRPGGGDGAAPAAASVDAPKTQPQEHRSLHKKIAQPTIRNHRVAELTFAKG